MSDTERLQPIGDQEDGVFDPMDADEIRAVIDEGWPRPSATGQRPTSSLRTHGPGWAAGTMEATPTLECPKCGSEMRSYERNGVMVDQCTGCKGLFLDRGELERLVDAEGRTSGARRSPAPRPLV